MWEGGFDSLRREPISFPLEEKYEVLLVRFAFSGIHCLLKIAINHYNKIYLVMAKAFENRTKKELK